ncbi:MAG TPA: excinuclease ATPase subunit [Xanthomonadales bacterium]|nr:excinuclease ATPase subunit [Xanthomonadales bacterium]
MRFALVTLVVVASLLFVNPTQARNTLHQLPIADVLNNPDYAAQLEGVKFYFGNQPHPEVVKSFGQDRTNKKTNAFGKSDDEACQWVMLSALLQLKQRADQLGANAVINIKSNYKNNLTSSETEYTCGAGAIMSGVALVGDFVLIE